MPEEIQRELLSQTKKYLASSDFENAVKTARGALAMDEANSEAADIIKASEAALGQSNVT